MGYLQYETYAKEEIDSKPEKELAWVLSEIMNDNAPIGWSKYIWIAECLLANYDITPKVKKE